MGERNRAKNAAATLNLLDSDSTISNQDPFDITHQIFDMSQLEKDPNFEDPENPEPPVKSRRKKKKRGPEDEQSFSWSSVSETSSEERVALGAVPTREEFYDAHDSFHTLPESQRSAAPIDSPIMVLDASTHDVSTKPMEERGASQTNATSTAAREASVINKPVITQPPPD